MADIQERLEKLLGELKQQRDELAVKMHLAKADARDAWAEMEKKWEQLRSKMALVGHEAKDVSHDVTAAVERVGAELKKGYERIRKALS